MFEKIKDYIPQLIGKIKNGLENTPKPVKWITLAYGLGVAVVLVLYMCLFMYEYTQGKTRSAELLPFLNILIGGAFVGFVSFMIGLVIDSNGNGIPDSMEEKRLR